MTHDEKRAVQMFESMKKLTPDQQEKLLQQAEGMVTGHPSNEAPVTEAPQMPSNVFMSGDGALVSYRTDPQFWDEFRDVKDKECPPGHVQIQNAHVWADGTIAFRVEQPGAGSRAPTRQYTKQEPPEDATARLSIIRDFWQAKLDKETADWTAFQEQAVAAIRNGCSWMVKGDPEQLLREGAERIAEYRKKLTEIERQLAAIALNEQLASPHARTVSADQIERLQTLSIDG